MHKRILAIFVALVLLVCLCSISVSAVGTDADEDVPYIELMDYIMAPVDSTIPGAFYVMGEYGFVGNFMLSLGSIPAYGYEVTYSFVGNRPTVTGVNFGSVSDNDFKSRFIDECNIGKIRGSFGGSLGQDFGVSFYSDGCFITIHSFRIFLVPDYQVHLSAVVYGNGVTQPFTPGGVASVSTSGYATIEIDDWRNFDVVSASATLGGCGITSVSARLIDNLEGFEYVIPFDMNYINLSDQNGDHENVLLTIDCDLRSIDPATAPDSTLIISITTAVPSGEYGHIQLTEVYGSLLISSPDKYLNWLKMQFLTLQNIDTNTFGIYDYIDNIYVDLHYFIEDFPDIIGSLPSAFAGLFSSLKDHISAEFDSFLQQSNQFAYDLEIEKITYWTPFVTAIVNSLAVDQQQKEEVEQSSQGMTSAGSSLSDLGAEMDSYTPSLSVDDISFDATSLVPALGMASAGTLASIVTSDPLIASMLLIVATLALVAFVLFGKR